MDFHAFTLLDRNYLIQHYPNPQRWEEFELENDNPVRDENNWSKWIKYLNDDGSTISDEFLNLPSATGAIYVFEIKGGPLPFLDSYLLYIGRVQLTKDQDLRKRVYKYAHPEKESRLLIQDMIECWGKYLYFRYCCDDDNSRIRHTEEQLIGAIAPPYNSVFPKRIKTMPTQKAFK